MSQPDESPLKVVPEATPNPLCWRFAVNRPLHDGPGREYSSLLPADDSPLARALLAIPSVSALYIGADFVAVAASPDADWTALQGPVVQAIENHVASGQPAVNPSAAVPRPESEVEAGIIRILDEEIRPAVAMDGGDIVFASYKDGIVRVHLRGACHGCPSAVITLKMGVEVRLKRLFPEVVSVEAV
jgi:Fe-S cluster biogenesis protein NfuA